MKKALSKLLLAARDCLEIYCPPKREIRKKNKTLIFKHDSPGKGNFKNRNSFEAPILWPPNVKSRFIGKDPDAGKD